MLSFAPIFVVSVIFGYMPPISAILTGTVSMFTAYGVLYVIEPVSYFPILGIPGTFLSFLAGSSIIASLPPSVTAAFNLILPALMGAIFIQFAVRDPKMGVIALSIATILTFMAKKGYLSFLHKVHHF